MIQANEFLALLLLGLSPLFGSEFGLAAILAYALLRLHLVVSARKNKTFTKDVLYLIYRILIIFVTTLIGYTLFTQGHPIDAIRYAFIDIPMDQGWYFGSDPNPFLEWGNAVPGLFNIKTIYFWIVAGCALIVYFSLIRKGDRRKEKTAMFFAVSYGGILFFMTIWGYYAPEAQLLGMQRMLVIILIAIFVDLIFNKSSYRLSIRTNDLKTRFSKYLILFLKIIAVAIIFITVPICSAYAKITLINEYQIKNILTIANKARMLDDYFVAGAGWKTSIDVFRTRIDPNQKIWSTYTSLYDSAFGNQTNPSSGGEDYIISCAWQ